MEMKKLALPAAILAVLVFIGYRKYKLVSSAVFTFDGIAINSLSPVQITAVIGIFNPTSATASVGNITGNIYANGSSIAAVSVPGLFTIAGNQKTSLPITVRPTIDIMTAVNLVLGYLRDKSVHITLNGSAEADGFTVPINVDLV